MRRSAGLLVAVLASVSAVRAFAADAPPNPPVARKVPRTIELHGQKLKDDYYWLRDKPSLEVREYLEAENAYADAFMAGTEGLQKRLYEETLSRIKETDLTVPYKRGGWYYATRTEAGKQYPIYTRRKGSADTAAEVFLDLNELAKGQKFMSIGTWQVSDDGDRLAYTTDNTGFRDYTLHVRDLVTGKDGPESVERVRSAAWASDGKTLFYTTTNDAKRSYRLYRHVLGQPKDTLLTEEKDERFNIFVRRSRDGRLLLLGAGSRTQSEWRVWPADQPEAPMKLVAERKRDHEYDVDNHGDVLYVRTNDGCRNFRIATAPLSDPSPASWKELVPCRADVMVEDLDVFAGHLVLSERAEAVPRISVRDLSTGATRTIAWDEPLHTVGLGQNFDFGAKALRVEYQSATTPLSVYDVDMASGKRTLLKKTEVPGGYDASQYVSERGFATAKDGTKIPLSIVYRKGFKKDGKAPAYLTAYGSYGIPSNLTFSSPRISLLDRGFVFVLAHIRGGGDLGKRWHDEGRMMSKKNTFTDFVDAAQAIVDQKWTSKERLAIQGGSAGGLLMGAVTNMRPDLFACVLSHVPFVDVINTMLDESLPLTVEEFEEWGNPKKADEYAYMASYSPYDNLAAKAYPPILVKTSLDDSQVMYWEPAKYVAKLRSLKTDANPLLLKTNMAGGHGGSSGRYDRFKELAFDMAFVVKTLKAPEEPVANFRAVIPKP
jgi:oligopeptidase B